MIHEIKNLIKNCGGKYFFPNNTIIELDRFEEYISTQLVAMFIKGNVLFINTYTEKYGVETDKVSDFHNDFVQEFYKIAFA